MPTLMGFIRASVYPYGGCVSRSVHAAAQPGQLAFLLVSIGEMGVDPPVRFSAQMCSRYVPGRHLDWPVFVILDIELCHHRGHQHLQPSEGGLGETPSSGPSSGLSTQQPRAVAYSFINNLEDAVPFHVLHLLLATCFGPLWVDLLVVNAKLAAECAQHRDSCWSGSSSADQVNVAMCMLPTIVSTQHIR